MLPAILFLSGDAWRAIDESDVACPGDLVDRPLEEPQRLALVETGDAPMAHAYGAPLADVHAPAKATAHAPR